eukprot:5145199-Lingulodinium_polyedra.AAC.1
MPLRMDQSRGPPGPGAGAGPCMRRRGHGARRRRGGLTAMADGAQGRPGGAATLPAGQVAGALAAAGWADATRGLHEG